MRLGGFLFLDVVVNLEVGGVARVVVGALRQTTPLLSYGLQLGGRPRRLASFLDRLFARLDQEITLGLTPLSFHLDFFVVFILPALCLQSLPLLSRSALFVGLLLWL